MSSKAHNLKAQIHIAKTQLGMDDDVYRALLEQTTGKRSCRDMTARELLRVIEQLKRKGFRPRRKNSSSDKGPRSSTFKSQGDKIRALWLDMFNQGIVRDASETALRNYIRRMTRGKYAAPQFCDAKTASHIIEALKQWQKRFKPEGGHHERDA
ncbi:gp16 family protein [Gynuella sp.]|uniref:gp16 family protein n=1 Tax=Gynuella sp. TaxID=2969146 RepID=UPI003D0DD4CB